MSAGFNYQAGSGVQAGSGLRVSDAERDAAAAELREHYAAGRLSLDELNERISQAFAARTRGDLSAVLHDLPSSRSGGAPLPGSGQPSSGAGWTGQGRWPDTGRRYQHAGSGGPGHHGPRRLGEAIGLAIATVVAMSLLAGFGVMAVTGTGFGGSRPIGIVLLLAAFALLRRLLFGRARRGRTRPVRTRRGPRRRR